MTNDNLKPEDVFIDRIFLNNENPRFKPVETEKEAVERLCAKEFIYELAADIVKQGGINPLEHFALILRDAKNGDKQKTYTVIEGNRRLCALKLLNDPEQAPDNLRKKFQTLSENWTQEEIISAVIFPDFDSTKVWLERMHGSQGGIGRKPWSSEQKQRFFDNEENRLSQNLLDRAQKNGFITDAERQNKLTTVTRFMVNKKFRECLELDESDPEKFQSALPDADFDKLIKQFINDLKEGKKVNSRMNKDEIEEYAEQLKSSNNGGTNPSPTPSIPAPIPEEKEIEPIAPPTPPKCIEPDLDIKEALRDLGDDGYKLHRLYFSITKLKFKDHSLIIYIGVWVFFEALTAYAGHTDNAFTNYFDNNRLQNTFGIPKSDAKAIREALKRISEQGNIAKHHKIAASFDGEQLSNDMKVLRGVILKTIEEAKPNKS